MEFGFPAPIRGPAADPETMATIVARGEELGFSYVTVSDHTVIPRGIDSRYPYNASGEFPGLQTGEALDQLAVIAFLAARTSSIRLLTSVLILPIRNPVVMANQLATLDVLSQGRLTVGCGVGWMREEFEATGAAPFERRGAVSDEFIAAFRELWSSDNPRFDGEFVRFADVKFEPKPVQQPSIPIWIGGESKAALRRSGRSADGWYPITSNPRHPVDTLERFVVSRDEVRRQAEEVGRDPERIDMAINTEWESTPRTGSDGSRSAFTGPADAVAGDVSAWEAAGVGQLIVRIASTDPSEYVERLAEFSETVMAKN